jgi:hypothetical protein
MEMDHGELWYQIGALAARLRIDKSSEVRTDDSLSFECQLPGCRMVITIRLNPMDLYDVSTVTGTVQNVYADDLGDVLLRITGLAVDD